MLTTVILAVVGVVAGILLVVVGLASAKPDNFQVERTASIGASPERVFACIDDFRNWAAWSPWEKLDPAMNKNFSGAGRGRGAVYKWSGNSRAGEGRMEILESSLPRHIGIKLDFIKPFEGHNTCDFTLSPDGAKTNVTWAMTGPSPFMMKVMRVFVDMDKMVGKDFEAGLANLKSVTESSAAPAI